MNASMMSHPAWVVGFFSPPNMLHWQDLRAGLAPDNWADDVIPWLELDARAEATIPVCVPFLTVSGETEWYASARDRRAAIALRDELTAFVGPSYSDFDGAPFAFEAVDTARAAFLNEFTESAYRIVPASPEDIPRIRRSLNLFRAVVERRPPRSRVATKTLGLIRGEFERALLAGDETAAHRLADEMRRSGRLSAENHRYLEVRFLAGLGRWQQIAGNLHLLRSLKDLHVPAGVLTDVADAIYHSALQQHLENGDAEAARTAFQNLGFGDLKSLFGTRRGLTRTSVLVVLILLESLKLKPDIAYLQTLLDGLKDQVPDRFVRCLRSLFLNGGDAVAGPQLADAEAAFDDSEYDRAVLLYATLSPTRKTLSRLITCAKLIGNPVTTQQVVDIANSAPVTVINQLTKSQRESLDQLRLEVSNSERETGLDSWLSWAKRVSEGLPFEPAVRIVQENATHWNVANLVSSPQEADELASLLSNMDEAILAEIFPHLYRALEEAADQRVANVGNLYGTLLTLLCLREAMSIDDLELANQLTTSILEAGPSKNQYSDMVKDLHELLQRSASFNTLIWALDIAETLAVGPAPDGGEARLGFFVNVLELARRFRHRLGEEHFLVLGMLCQDCEIQIPEELKPDAETLRRSGAEVQSHLSNRTIGIYTLVGSAGERAKSLLETLWRGVRVSVNSDHTCTDRLAALAKNADVFVFAWKSSKHQAYYCVKDNRPKDMPLLHPLGKGSASIVRSVVEAI